MSESPGRIGWVNFWKPKDEWYYLPRAERDRLLGEWQAIREAAVGRGAICFGSYECRASTAWARVSLWEFPDLESLTGMVDALAEAAYYQYFAEENAFGRRSEEPFANYMAAADVTVSYGGT